MREAAVTSSTCHGWRRLVLERRYIQPTGISRVETTMPSEMPRKGEVITGKRWPMAMTMPPPSARGIM